MTYRTRYSKEAQEDLFDAVRFYEQREAGLGGDFLDEVESALADVREHPKRWPRIRRTVRKRNTRRFPFAIIYAILRDLVYVIAVADLRRGPRWWRKRLKGWR
jgi:plasmid stabilization system protein ParE